MSVRDTNGGGTTASEPNGASIAGSPENGAKRPFGVLVASAVGGFRTLIRQRVELAKLEATEAATSRAKGAGMMAAAAILALFGLGFGAAAGAAGLALVVPTWAAILIVAAVFFLATGVLVFVGRRTMQTAPKGERTQETLKEDAEWAKQQIAR